MRIGLIADVHGNFSALRAALREMGRVRRILCAGDLVGLCATPDKVIRLVRKKGIPCVLGDCDRAVLTGSFEGLPEEARAACEWTRARLDGESMKFLAKLPERMEVKVGSFRILVVHGSPADPLRGRIPPEATGEQLSKLVAGVEADVIVVGHTHLQFSKMILGKLLVNPGSVGHPKDRNPDAGFAVLDLESGVPRVEMRRAKYSVEEEVSLLKKESLPPSIASRILYGW